MAPSDTYLALADARRVVANGRALANETDAVEVTFLGDGVLCVVPVQAMPLLCGVTDVAGDSIGVGGGILFVKKTTCEAVRLVL